MLTASLFDVPAKDSPIFWAFIGLIACAILLVVFRDLILWYFRLNDVYDRLDELAEKVDRLAAGGVKPVSQIQAPNAPQASFAPSDAELAAAIALAKHNSE